jgi:hypothetical protein
MSQYPKNTSCQAIEIDHRIQMIIHIYQASIKACVKQ